MNDSVMDILNSMVDEGHFEKVVSKSELLYDRKIWNSDILTEGGLSFIKDEETSRVYKVSMTNKSNDIVYKWRIKTATGEIFSVCSKTSSESQKIVNKIYGKNKYTVSMMLL